MSHRLIANYTIEQKHFQALISNENHKILLFEGASGTGKTHLINFCLSQLNSHSWKIIHLDLKQGSRLIQTLFEEFVMQLGWQHMVAFTQRVAGIAGEPHDLRTSNWETRLSNHLDQINRHSDLATRRGWYSQITTAFFEDIERVGQRTLLVIDTYEQSGTDFSYWLVNDFLPKVAETATVKIIIAGQTPPKIPSENSSKIKHIKLTGVINPKEWRDWAIQKQIEIPPFENLSDFCHDQNGLPREIVKGLETFQYLNQGQRENFLSNHHILLHLSNKLESAFNLTELYKLCLSVGINYETIPEHRVLSPFIRELLIHTFRTNKLDEFRQKCVELRPSFDWSTPEAEDSDNQNPQPIIKPNSFTVSKIESAFNLSELYSICFKLRIKPETIPYHTVLTPFIRELLIYLNQSNQLTEFKKLCIKERPNINWDTRLEIPSGELGQYLQSTSNLLPVMSALDPVTREKELLAFNLNVLTPLAQEAVKVAAIPHWFNSSIISAMMGESAAEQVYSLLTNLSFVDEFKGRGYTIHEATRHLLLEQLWEDDPTHFINLSHAAADYFLQAAKESTGHISSGSNKNHFHNEEIYHRLIAEPDVGISRFEEMATEWANYEQRSYGDIERIIKEANEHIDKGRLTRPVVSRVKLWQARLMLIYGRPAAADSILANLAFGVMAEPSLNAQLASLRGDVAAAGNDRQQMALQWQQALISYQEANQPIDSYLVAEKMRSHQLPSSLDQLAENSDAKAPPNRLTLQLLNNIEDAWINGVLLQAINDENQSLNLGMTRAEPNLITGHLRIHRQEGIDKPITGRGLSGLFEASGQSLLILGAPGSGKTITLLQLLDELIQQSRIDIDAAVPLLFNLSSFGKFDGDFIDWLSEQAYDQYRLSRKVTKKQIQSGRRFILLLDGLDEISNINDKRNFCLKAINSFINQNRSGIVVCSRISDYKQLKSNLHVNHAVVIQPLTNQQIEAALNDDLQKLPSTYWQLKEAIRCPLLLTLFPYAFPDSASLKVIQPPNSMIGWQNSIFKSYIDQRLPKDARKPLSNTRSFGWLIFLAQKMQKVGTSIFNIEDLQPTWLSDSNFQLQYIRWSGLLLGMICGSFLILVNVLLSDASLNLIRVSMFAGIPIGGVIGFIVGHLSSYFNKKYLRIIFCSALIWIFASIPFVGAIEEQGAFETTNLLNALVNGLVKGLGSFVSLNVLFNTPDINIHERVKFVVPSIRRVIYYLFLYSIIGVIGGITIGTIAGIISMFYERNTEAAISVGLYIFYVFGFFGAIFSSGIGIILSIFDNAEISVRLKPAEGIIGSFRNSMKMTLLIFASISLFAKLLDVILVGNGVLTQIGIMWILPLIFTFYGGMAWCQHWALRFVMYRHSYLPYRLIPWLNKLVELGLMRRVGGGYIFLHRAILEYFATLDPESK